MSSANTYVDTLGQEIKNGDFVVSASKSEGNMIFGVMKNVATRSRIRIDKLGTRWIPAKRQSSIYDMKRTVRISDEAIAAMNPELFEVMNQVREGNYLPTNRGLIEQQRQLKELLKNML